MIASDGYNGSILICEKFRALCRIQINGSLKYFQRNIIIYPNIMYLANTVKNNEKQFDNDFGDDK